MSELIKRLRKSKAVWSTSALGALADEAADRIAELEAQVANFQSDAYVLSLLTKIDEIEAVVNEQAEDEGLWFVAQTAPEAYLQEALRKLHAVIEDIK